MHNIDMNLDGNEGVPRNSQMKWGRDHKEFGDSWLHSDMKDMAFFYVHELYKQLVQKGNLK